MATDKTYFERTYRQPFKGWDTSVPENQIPAEASPFLESIYLYRGEARTFPGFVASLLGAPGTFDPTVGNHGFPIRSIISAKVLDINSDIAGITTTKLKLGSFVLTDNGLYVLRPYWRNNFTFPGPIPWTINDPVWLRLSIGNLYGSWPNFKSSWPIICSEGTLYYSVTDALRTTPPPIYSINLYSFNYINGEQQILLDATHQLAGRFMGVLNGHLILANTLTLDNTTGQLSYDSTRVRWSASGNFTHFDPNSDIGAGFNDLSETPDEITGFMLMGRNALIFRTNGITEMFPLGGIAPFGFNHMWASDRGIGNIVNGTVSNYGSLGIFVSEDDIYAVSTANFKPISGGAKYQIYIDIANRADDSSLNSSIISLLVDGHIHLMYVLNIIQSNNSNIIWFYSITGEYWMRKVFLSNVVNPLHFITAPAVAIAQGLDGQPNPDPANPSTLIPEIKNKNRIAAFATVDDITGANAHISFFDPTQACENDCIYQYRVEDFEEGKQPTIHKIRIRYRDVWLGDFQFNITLSGEGVPDLKIFKTITGLNDNKIKTSYIDQVFSAKAPQLKWEVDAGVIDFPGPPPSHISVPTNIVSIVSMTLCGNLGDGPEL